MADRTFTEAN